MAQNTKTNANPPDYFVAGGAQSLTTLTTITTNNNITTLMFTPSGDKHQQESYGHLLASPVGLREEDIPAEQTVGLNVSAAPKWKYAKVDLFDNTTEKELAKGKRKLRLALSFLTHTSSNYKYLGALVNTRMRDVKRGFDFSDPSEQQHYELLIQTYTELVSLKYQNVRLSKCYQRAVRGKGPTIFGTSVILAEKPQLGEYLCIIVDGIELHAVELSGKQLTDKQRAGNCISSGQLGSNVATRRTRNDFFSD
jgi:hypothetical protein